MEDGANALTVQALDLSAACQVLPPAQPQQGNGTEEANDALRYAVVAAMAAGKGIDAVIAQGAAQHNRGSASRSPRREHLVKQTKTEGTVATR